MLDDLDRELLGRGHRFVRYADDVRVLRSERAPQKVFEGVYSVMERRLKLKVDRGSPRWHAALAVLLGFGFFLPARRSRLGRPEGGEAAEGPVAES